MERAGFTCEHCLSGKATLHVHHKYYETDRAPWDYPIDSLECLCEECHGRAQDVQVRLKRAVGRIQLREQMEELLGFALGLAATFSDDVIDAFSPNVLRGLCQGLGLPTAEVKALLKDGQIDGTSLRKLSERKWIELEHERELRNPPGSDTQDAGGTPPT